MRRCFVDPIASLGYLACASGLLGAGGVSQDDKTVPVHQEPHHHLVFDSPGTRILDIQIPPGATTLFHTHSDPILYVTMGTSQTRSQTLGREWSGGGSALVAPAAPVAPSAAPGRIGRMNSNTGYIEQPLTHRVNNIGQTLFRLIGVINRSAGDETTAPSADFAAKPEVDNRWFRGYRWTLTGDTMSEHRHANPVAIVLVTGRAVVNGSSKIALDEPGVFAWLDVNAPHRLQSNGGDAEVVEVEVRRSH